jgi:uncharacterized protein YndB with AHSA1/START domain
MLKIIAIAAVVLLAGILVFAATKPDTMNVQRTTMIKAAPDKIFARINDFHNWPAWSPYEKMDPNMKRTLSGAPNGKGAIYEWQGNGNVGKGRMEITESSAPGKIAIKLDFEKPLEGHDIAEFTLVAKGDSTEVTWAMHGPNPYLGKVMQVFLNMDNMIGSQFDAGLANLKALTEK